VAFEFPDINTETMVEDPLGALTRFWDWAKSQAFNLVPELRQVVEEWVAFGIDLSDALHPRVALFFGNPLVAEGARLLPPFVWLSPLDPEIVSNVRFSPPHVPPPPGLLAAQPVAPGATICCDVYNIAGSLITTEYGTLGALLGDTSSPPNRWILSAAHVAALNVNHPQWHVNISVSGIGAVSSQVTPVPLTDGLNKADAAIARLSAGLEIAPAIPRVPLAPGLPPAAPGPGAPVSKFGMATKLTSGTLAYRAPRIEIELAGAIDRPHCQFADQLLLRSQPGGQFAGPGDSGALVVSASGGRNYPLGLLIAWQESLPSSGNPLPADLTQPVFAVATPFDTVIEQLNSVSGLSLSLLIS